jgi:hypothetical protein
MLARRSVLAALGGGVVVAASGLAAQAASLPSPGPAGSDAPRTVADLRRGLASTAPTGAPREMQYYVVRRRYWVRRYYVRPRRFVWRCWWNGYGRYCRWRYI